MNEGYIDGVPMGGDLAPVTSGKSPGLMIWATRGPHSGNLDRIQVIKGWVDANGDTQEKIYNAVWAGKDRFSADGSLKPIKSTVIVSRAKYTNTVGEPELRTLWTDPDFDPDLPAFYYLRVLEINTPRWSTYDAKALEIAPPEDFPAIIQERAWTSPIWYQPKRTAKLAAL